MKKITEKRIKGRILAKKIQKNTEKIVQKLSKKNVIPLLAILLIGNDKPSQLYVRKKQKIAHKIGIKTKTYHLPANTTYDEVSSTLSKIKRLKHISGIVLQLPLPKHLPTTKIIDLIPPHLDIDCITPENIGKLFHDDPLFYPPTPGGIFTILDSKKIRLTGKHVVLIGSGMLVGKPLALMLLNMGATVTICNSKTKNLALHTKQADIIISGVGKRNVITKDMVKKGIILIDAGTSFYKKKMYGDLAYDELFAKAKYITPTPGGVGPLTVQKLLENTAKSAQQLYG